MNAIAFPFDVAFSFVRQDEDLAALLEGLLAGRLQTFLYSRRQDDLVGRDGEETLNRVFGRDARIVVVLYREGWGQTPWTRVEETALRNRAYNEGYDFALFVLTQQAADLPQWVPRTRIWFDLERWGPQAAAAIIENRVQQAGGDIRVETAVDRAARLKRELDADNERRAFLESTAGVNAAVNEAQALFGLVEATAHRLDYLTEAERDIRDVHTHGFTVAFAWSQAYANTTRDSRLYVTLWQGRHDIAGRRFFRQVQPTELQRAAFCFDRGSRGYGWREDRNGTVFQSTQQVVDYGIDLLTNRIRRERLGRR